MVCAVTSRCLVPHPLPHGGAISISQHCTAAILAQGVLDAEFVSDMEPAVVGMQYKTPLATLLSMDGALLRATSNTTERQYEVEAKHDTDDLTKMFDELAAVVDIPAAVQLRKTFQQQSNYASTSAKSISSSGALRVCRRFSAKQQQSSYASTSVWRPSSGTLRVCRRFDAKQQQSSYASTSAKSILTRAQVLHMNQAKLRDLCSDRF